MKNSIKISILVLVLVAIGFFIFRSKNIEQNQEIGETVAAAPPVAYNERPNLPLTNINGSKLNAQAIQGKSVLIFFQPDCDHCQREAEQIQENLHAFQGYQLYFISDAGLPQIAEFARKYKLAGNATIHFTQTSIADIMRTIGAVQLPSVYVYSGQGKLVKSFNGETPIGWILSALQ